MYETPQGVLKFKKKHILIVPQCITKEYYFLKRLKKVLRRNV